MVFMNKYTVKSNVAFKQHNSREAASPLASATATKQTLTRAITD